MTGKIVITADTSEDGILHTNIDVDVKNVSALEAVSVISNLARSLQIPLVILPDALKFLAALDADSEHICVDKALIEQALESDSETGD